MSEGLIVWLSTNRVATFLIKHVASRVDPWLFRRTNGRFTVFGPPSMPMLTLTTRGRKSGKERSVHLACVERDGDPHVVASAMGQERHPAWRYNLEASPEVEVQMQGERFRAIARVLTSEEKAELWPEVKRDIPQMKVYEKRTDRDIRIFRLTRTDA